MDYKCDGNLNHLNSEKIGDCYDGSFWYTDESDESLGSCCDGNHPAYNDYICEYKDYVYANFGK